MSPSDERADRTGAAPRRSWIRGFAARRNYAPKVIAGEFEREPAAERIARRERRVRWARILQTVGGFGVLGVLALGFVIGPFWAWATPGLAFAYAVFRFAGSLGAVWDPEDRDLYVLRPGKDGPRRVHNDGGIDPNLLR